MEEDIISRLPDAILISIVTPIPTKEAIRTSILSKRWRNVHKFVSAINISFSCRHSKEGFEEIIDGLHRLSQLHSGFIRFFKCCCCLTQYYSSAFEVRMYPLGKYIEKLHLQFSHSEVSRDFIFPCDLLSHMPCLKYFKLRYCCLQPNFSSHCNSLKTLRLSKVEVAPGSLENILCNCLNLSTLLIRNCELPSKLCIRGPQLKCLMIYEWSACCVQEIELYAGNLIIFEFFSIKDVDILFDYVPQLQHIYLVSFKYFQTLSKDLSHLNSIHLHFREQLFDEHIHQDIICKGDITFNNVARLELSVKSTIHDNLLSLMPLLHSCPNLQEFHLALMDCRTFLPHWERSVVVHRKLKKVDISGFRDQCELVLYILKCAVALQQLHISWYSNEYNGFGQWEERAIPPYNEKKIVRMYECIRGLIPQAASETVQVMLEKFPRIKSKQDEVWTEDLS